MTLKDLSQLYYLKKEIEMDHHRIRGLEAQLQPGSQKFSGLPHGAGFVDKMGTYVAQIADLKGIIEDKQRQCILEQKRLENYIAGVQDSFMRQILTYRFVNGFSWRKVAACVGGRNTDSSVQKAVQRYLKNNQAT